MLIKDIPTIQIYVPNINSDMKFERLEQTIRRTESKHIKPLLGTVLYDIIVAYFDAGQAPTNAVYDGLIPVLQDSLANISCHDGYEKLVIKIGDSGTYTDQREEKGDPYQYQERNLKTALLRDGWNGKELILEYLEENKAGFTEWVNSTAYTEYKQYFLPTAIEFTKHYPVVRESRLVYRLLVSDMDTVERFHIATAIGAEYFDDLKAKLLSDGLTANDELVVKDIRYAIAHLTISEAILKLQPVFTGTGIFFTETGTGGRNTSTNTVPEPDYISSLQSKASQQGSQHLAQVRNFLQKNADTYPLFKNSSAYREEGAGWKIKTGKIVRL